MKISEAIREADNLEPNQYVVQDKITWLSRLDLKVKREVFDAHYYNEGEIEVVFDGYGEGDVEAELLVGEPFAEMYIHWLQAQINYHNREFDSFNASNAMFDSIYTEFKNAYHGSHRPRGFFKKYF